MITTNILRIAEAPINLGKLEDTFLYEHIKQSNLHVTKEKTTVAMLEYKEYIHAAYTLVYSKSKPIWTYIKPALKAIKDFRVTTVHLNKVITIDMEPFEQGDAYKGMQPYILIARSIVIDTNKILVIPSILEYFSIYLGSYVYQYMTPHYNHYIGSFLNYFNFDLADPLQEAGEIKLLINSFILLLPTLQRNRLEMKEEKRAAEALKEDDNDEYFDAQEQCEVIKNNHLTKKVEIPEPDDVYFDTFDDSKVQMKMRKSLILKDNMLAMSEWWLKLPENKFLLKYVNTSNRQYLTIWKKLIEIEQNERKRTLDRINSKMIGSMTVAMLWLPENKSFLEYVNSTNINNLSEMLRQYSLINEYGNDLRYKIRSMFSSSKGVETKLNTPLWCHNKRDGSSCSNKKTDIKKYDVNKNILDQNETLFENILELFVNMIIQSKTKNKLMPYQPESELKCLILDEDDDRWKTSLYINMRHRYIQENRTRVLQYESKEHSKLRYDNIQANITRLLKKHKKINTMPASTPRETFNNVTKASSASTKYTLANRKLSKSDHRRLRCYKYRMNNRNGKTINKCFCSRLLDTSFFIFKKSVTLGSLAITYLYIKTLDTQYKTLVNDLVVNYIQTIVDRVYIDIYDTPAFQPYNTTYINHT